MTAVRAAALAPDPASALYCVHPRDQLKDYALIVEGKATDAARGTGRSESGGPAPDRVTLAVNRYVKGEGPGNLVLMFDGQGWKQMNPAGSDLVMAVRQDDKTKEYWAGACLLRINAKPTNAFEEEMRTLIQKQYGEGHPPAVPAHEREPTLYQG